MSLNRETLMDLGDVPLHFDLTVPAIAGTLALLCLRIIWASLLRSSGHNWQEQPKAQPANIHLTRTGPNAPRRYRRVGGFRALRQWNVRLSSNVDHPSLSQRSSGDVIAFKRSEHQ